MFNIFFPKIVPFMRWCGQICWSQTGHRRKYNMTQKICELHAERLR